MTTAAQWITAYAERLGIECPSDDDVATILALAGVAAHDAQRTAAPIACWLGARAGLDPLSALELARSLTLEDE